MASLAACCRWRPLAAVSGMFGVEAPCVSMRQRRGSCHAIAGRVRPRSLCETELRVLHAHEGPLWPVEHVC
jgi:hypothetical protein